MALLLTPSSLQYILCMSFMSRILVILIQLISNLTVEDHYADAYRNKYHKALNEQENLVNLLPKSYRYLYAGIEGFTKWDAQYFLEISKDGYISEQHLAFFPLYPMLISLTRQLIFGHRRLNLDQFFPTQTIDQTVEYQKVNVADLVNYIQGALVGVALNNFLLMPIASVFLYAFTKIVKENDEKYARDVVLWFCFNPASVFFSACYSEPLFVTLTFISIFIIESRSQNYLLRDVVDNRRLLTEDQFEPLRHLNRLIYTMLPALVPLALASATRSNGLVNIGFIIFHFLIKYTPLIGSKFYNWTFLGYLSTGLEFIQDALVLVMSAVLAASGYISFQIYSFIRFCVNNVHMDGKYTPFSRPLWCNNLIPHPYGQVQAKYWNVGLFKYYQIKQLPNFALAAPIALMVLHGSLRRAQILPSRARISKMRQELAYYLQAILLVLLCSISINVQVITRLLISSSPAVFWICADLRRAHKIYSRLISIYCFSYLLLGTLLHTNFYPWT